MISAFLYNLGWSATTIAVAGSATTAKWVFGKSPVSSEMGPPVTRKLSATLHIAAQPRPTPLANKPAKHWLSIDTVASGSSSDVQANLQHYDILVIETKEFLTPPASP